nr:two component sensor with CHASE2 and GGDEF domain [uncultured bacterium]
MKIKHFVRTFFLASFLTILLFVLEGTVPFCHYLNLKGRDWLFRLKHHVSEVPPENQEITLVVLDDPSLDVLETRWPYPRSFHAQVLRNIEQFKPKAVAFDLVFSGDDFAEGSDEILAEELKKAGNVVVAAHKYDYGAVGPIDLIKNNAAGVGLVDKGRDEDRVIRHWFPVRTYNNELFQSWELLLLKIAHPEMAENFDQSVGYIINFLLKPRQFKQIPYWKAYQGKIQAADFKDKLVLIGLTSITFHDIHATPLGTMPGLMVNANTLLTVLTGKTFQFVPFSIRFLISFMGFFIILSLALLVSAMFGVLTVILLAIILFGISFYLFQQQLIFDITLMYIGLVLTLIGAVIYREGQLFLENLRLREESSRDPLTGFYSRRFMELKLKSEVGRLSRGFHSAKEVSVIMIDLDNFKLVNDSFGHAEGDRVLKTMAQSIRNSVRKEEVICRFGGDEFCVILPNTELKDATRFAEKLRQLIANNPDLSYRTAGGTDTIRVTGSIGVASVSGTKAMEPGGLLKAADQALYRAKKGGRNRVCVYDPKQDTEDPDAPKKKREEEKRR